MNVAIVGGGINGLSCAWLLASQSHEVCLFERGRLVGETSRASSKLLHGGLRYLENGEFRLVREALRERDGWLQRVPSLTRPLRLVLPIYRGGRRNCWSIATGLFLYDRLAGKSDLPRSTWLEPHVLLQRDPGLQPVGLLGGYEFSDGQMDDYRLGLWVAEQARGLGATLLERVDVAAIGCDGAVHLTDGTTQVFDRVVNAAGPWALRLQEQSSISSPYQLDVVRGSHLVLDRTCPQAYLHEVPGERRIFFVLPWQETKTLLGTTEVRQTLDEPVACSEDERHYLMRAYNHYRLDSAASSPIVETFSGLRPLLRSADDPSRNTREYAIHRREKLITVLGGKWTTSLALARNVAKAL